MTVSAFLPCALLSPHRHAVNPAIESNTCPSMSMKQNLSPGKIIAAAATSSLLMFAPFLHLDQASVHAAGKGGGSTFLAASGDVNKDAESLLRWSLPISNKPVRELQTSLESVIGDLKGLKWKQMDSDLNRSEMILKNSVDGILADIPTDLRETASQNLARILEDDCSGIAEAVQAKSKEKIIARTKAALRKVGTVEEMMITQFPYTVDSEYSSTLPQLLGRATVEMVVEKADGETFDIEGVLQKRGKLTVVIDGYSAPINGGSFVQLASEGFYDNVDITRSDGFIVQSGNPAGYKDKSGKIRTVPLEIFPKEDAKPFYGTTLEDDGRGASPTVLPFTSYGTLAMARQEFEPNSASSQFFWFLFEPDLTPAGRNLLDGSWSVFGYTTEGQNYLRGLQKGDKIITAKVTDGLQNLKMPSKQQPTT